MMRSWVRDFLKAAADGQPRRILTETSAAYREARITAISRIAQEPESPLACVACGG
jgi:hypothetical protein